MGKAFDIPGLKEKCARSSYRKPEKDHLENTDIDRNNLKWMIGWCKNWVNLLKPSGNFTYDQV
jgi:hypothetical protein